MPTVNLDLYAPHSAQLGFHNSNARFRVAAWGRQAGKTTACINEVMKRAWEKKGTYWYVLPIYDQAREAFRRMSHLLSTCPEIISKRNESELRIELIQGSVIVCKSGETLQRLRMATLDGVVVDEVRDQPPELWNQVLRPMLATTGGWASFVSTPAGFDSFYDLFERGGKEKDWAHFHAPSTCNPLFKQSEFDVLRSEMSEAEFAQEVLAEFRDLTSGKAYLNHGSHNHLDHSPFCKDGVSLINPHLPILVAMDFNLDPFCFVLGQHKNGEFYFFDEIVLRNSHTQEMAKELVERVWNHKPGVLVIGDATGKAGQRAAAGKSDYNIIFEALDAAGIRWINETPEANPMVRDRVNVVNSKLKAADGTVKLFYHPILCKNLKRDYERVTWRVGAQAMLDQIKDRTLTHSSDAAGYAVYQLTTQWAESPGLLRVLRR